MKWEYTNQARLLSQTLETKVNEVETYIQGTGKYTLSKRNDAFIIVILSLQYEIK